MPGEVVLAFAAPREAVPAASAVRGTLLLTSQRALKSRGLMDRYWELVEPAHKATLESLTANRWFDVSVARAHYAACEALALPRPVILSIGMESGLFMNNTLLASVARLAREAGVTPWRALPHVNQLIGRIWQGSSASVRRLGPKEARLEWVGMPMSTFAYFRVAFAGFIDGAASPFSRVMFVRELSRLCSGTCVAYRISWV
jgi:hypothetical protein